MAQVKTPCNQAHNRCNDKKSPAVRYEQTTIPCSVGISKFYTGKIEGNNFEGDLTLVTPNVELLTVDTDFFEMLDAPLDECGGKLRVKGHSHITLNKDFKKQLDLLARTGGIKTVFSDTFNTTEFKLFFATYLRRLIEDGIIRITDLFPNGIPNTQPQQPPTIINQGLDCNQLTNCPTIQDILRRLRDLEDEVRRLKNQPVTPPPTVNNNYPILNNATVTLNQGQTNYNLRSTIRSSYNPNGDASMKSFTIVGGEIQNFRYGGYPINIGEVYTNPDLLTFVGNLNSEITIQAQSQNNKNSNMAKITIRYAQIPDSYERCVRVSGNNLSNITYNIIRNTNSTGTFGSVTFTNSCSTPYTIPEIVFINEDGLRVFIPSFTLPGKSSETKTISITGAYNGSKNTITGNQSVNGTNIGVIINVTNSNTRPVTNDVTIESPNRTNTTITAANLNWSDAESDPLEKVKFTGNVSNLFTDPNHTTAYVAGTELDPNFTLYHKAPDQDAIAQYEFDYAVKAGGQWSL